MGHTYSQLLYHAVYSTQERRPIIHEAWRSNLFGYMSPIVTELGGHLIRAGGVADHVHVLLRLPPVIPIAKVIGALKTNTSKWVNDVHFSHNRAFAWQEGYGAFTASQSRLTDLIAYIDGQELHHQSRSFQDEFRELLRRHQIEIDERFVWS